MNNNPFVCIQFTTYNGHIYLKVHASYLYIAIIYTS